MTQPSPAHRPPPPQHYGYLIAQIMGERFTNRRPVICALSRPKETSVDWSRHASGIFGRQADLTLSLP